VSASCGRHSHGGRLFPGSWQTQIKQRLVVCRDGITPPIDGADGQSRRLSPQDLMSRRADGRLTAFLKLDVEQEAVATPPQSNEDRVAEWAQTVVMLYVIASSMGGSEMRRPPLCDTKPKALPRFQLALGSLPDKMRSRSNQTSKCQPRPSVSCAR
jgi:hypothetical protein